MLERLTSLFDEAALEPELLRLIDSTQTGIVVGLVALLTAAGIGAIHAIGPGHGKALIGAYLASTRGRPRDAVALGALVAVMHTASVLALGLVLQATQRVPDAAWLEPTLMLVSAVAITAVGISLVARQRARHRARSRAPSASGHGHRMGGHGAIVAAQHHDPSHGQDHVHTHDHAHELPDGVAPLSRGGIVALATSGGLLPSPAAFLVLATAIATGRTGFGLALVAAFGVGLAVTLTAVGLAVLWGRGRVSSEEGRAPWLSWLSRAVPFVAAWMVVGGGVLLAVAALVRW